MAQLISPAAAAAVPSVATLIDGAWGIVSENIRQLGDTGIQNNNFTWKTGPWMLAVDTFSNRQLKYAIVKTALELLFEHMGQHRWGTCTFWIWDGGAKVGEGRIFLMENHPHRRNLGPLPHKPEERKPSSRNHQSSTHLSLRDRPQIWRTVDHVTVAITMKTRYPTATQSSPIPRLFSEANAFILDQIQKSGDVPVPGGDWFHFPVGPFSMQLLPAISSYRAITWGMLSSALTAVHDYMAETRWGTCHFGIYFGGPGPMGHGDRVGFGFINLRSGEGEWDKGGGRGR